jgi:hypothetical protein
MLNEPISDIRFMKSIPVFSAGKEENSLFFFCVQPYSKIKVTNQYRRR